MMTLIGCGIDGLVNLNIVETIQLRRLLRGARRFLALHLFNERKRFDLTGESRIADDRRIIGYGQQHGAQLGVRKLLGQESTSDRRAQQLSGDDRCRIANDLSMVKGQI